MCVRRVPIRTPLELLSVLIVRMGSGVIERALAVRSVTLVLSQIMNTQAVSPVLHQHFQLRVIGLAETVRPASGALQVALRARSATLVLSQILNTQVVSPVLPRHFQSRVIRLAEIARPASGALQVALRARSATLAKFRNRTRQVVRNVSPQPTPSLAIRLVQLAINRANTQIRKVHPFAPTLLRDPMRYPIDRVLKPVLLVVLAVLVRTTVLRVS